MAVVQELDNQDLMQDTPVYACNNCGKIAKTRHQCTICADFDLCVKCFDENGHPHKMEKFEKKNSTSGDQKQTRSRVLTLLSIQRCAVYLVHACQCRSKNCKLPSCLRMKRILHHGMNCKRQTAGGCPICKHLTAICFYHAKDCQVDRCTVMICTQIKSKIWELDLRERMRSAMQRSYNDLQNHVMFGIRKEFPRGLL